MKYDSNGAGLVAFPLVDKDGDALRGPNVSLEAVGITASASFLPVAEAYSAGDIIAASAQFAFNYADGSPVEPGSLIRVLTAIMKIDIAALQVGEGAYTLECFSEAQPSAQANNAAFTLGSTADLTAYRGSIPLGTPAPKGKLYVKSPNIDLDIKLATSSLFARLITVAGFTATAVPRQVLLYGVKL